MAAQEMSGLEILGLASDLLGVIGPGADLVIGIVGFLAKSNAGPDPMVAALQKIDSRLGAIEDFALASWVTAREDNIAFLRAHSSTALETVGDFLKSGESASSLRWATRLALADRDSLLAVHTFVDDTDGGFWRRPESMAAISLSGTPNAFETGWMSHIPDRAEVDGFGRVWDHRWAMPVTIYTITVRLAVLRGMGTDLRTMRREVRRYNRIVAQVFKRMDAGIRTLDELSEEQIRRIPTHRVPIVAVDIHGGFYLGGTFDPFFRASHFTGFPFPAGSIVETSGGEVDLMLRNAKILTQLWRNHVAITIGLPDLLRLAGSLENLLSPGTTPPVSRHAELFSAGSGTPPDGGGFPNTGAFYGVTEDENLRWYRYAGIGDPAVTGLLAWHPGSGNAIAGWDSFQHLAGGGDGIILGVADDGHLHWYEYDGQGEEDPSGRLGWHPNSGNIIGRGWDRFVRIFVAPRNGEINKTLRIFALAANGELHWYSYSGEGEHDPAGALGWHPNSGHRIGNGWHNFTHVHGSGNVIFAVNPNGVLHWFSYRGEGEEDVSGRTGWDPRSGNPIGQGWQGMRHILGSVTDLREFGHMILAVNQQGELLWFKYAGQGESDIAGELGWIENSGNRIAEGF